MCEEEGFRDDDDYDRGVTDPQDDNYSLAW